MLFYVYKIVERSTGRYYLGKHCCSNMLNPLNDGYFGSGKKIKQLVKKYGKKAFLKEIIQTFDSEKDALQLEYNLINEHKSDPLCLSIASGGSGDSSQKKKIRARKKNIPYLNSVVENL